MELKWFVKESKYDFLPPDMQSLLTRGWGNGYVLIPPTSVLFGKHYDIINNYISVHGGLTFSELVDEKSIKHFNLNTSDLGMWCVGFDTAHFNDDLEKWPQHEVELEAIELAEQLENAEITIFNNIESFNELVTWYKNDEEECKNSLDF